MEQGGQPMFEGGAVAAVPCDPAAAPYRSEGGLAQVRDLEAPAVAGGGRGHGRQAGEVDGGEVVRGGQGRVLAQPGRERAAGLAGLREERTAWRPPSLRFLSFQCSACVALWPDSVETTGSLSAVCSCRLCHWDVSGTQMDRVAAVQHTPTPTPGPGPYRVRTAGERPPKKHVMRLPTRPRPILRTWVGSSPRANTTVGVPRLMAAP